MLHENLIISEIILQGKGMNVVSKLWPDSLYVRAVEDKDPQHAFLNSTSSSETINRLSHLLLMKVQVS